jgi:hypothetical protein
MYIYISICYFSLNLTHLYTHTCKLPSLSLSLSLSHTHTHTHYPYSDRVLQTGLIQLQICHTSGIGMPYALVSSVLFSFKYATLCVVACPYALVLCSTGRKKRKYLAAALKKKCGSRIPTPHSQACGLS